MEHPIVIVPIDDAEEGLWRVTHEIADLLAGLPWVLIGGQMVALLEREHGGMTGRATRDVDALMDVRALTGATKEAARRLESTGFAAELTNDGLSYRFARGADIVDVLAPENLGHRADLTTSPPGTTLETVGGTQALQRRRDVTINVLGDVFSLPVPTLTGALVIKARAASSSPNAKHLRDLARLLVIVPNIEEMRAQLTAKERGFLRAHQQLLDPANDAWRGVQGATDGVIALSRLAAQ
jgi:hypothetical protein